ncbi:hypothetical protein [Actinoplanes sp. NPDC049265]|uniref:hypothetical protein n=1 Tax=Actinoplanes sp. NPDC049265 TaxID=3363902 RepID=UPI0037150B82
MPSGPGIPERRQWRRARFTVRAGREKLDDERRGFGFGFGFGNLGALTAAIYLCLGGITLELPTET